MKNIFKLNLSHNYYVYKYKLMNLSSWIPDASTMTGYMPDASTVTGYMPDTARLTDLVAGEGNAGSLKVVPETGGIPMRDVGDPRLLTGEEKDAAAKASKPKLRSSGHRASDDLTAEANAAWMEVTGKPLTEHVLTRSCETLLSQCKAEVQALKGELAKKGGGTRRKTTKKLKKKRTYRKWRGRSIKRRTYKKKKKRSKKKRSKK